LDPSKVQILVAMILYIGVIIGIGLYYAKRANESSDNYLIGGRSLGPWVTAMGAEASDMSGWLLMGLPGVAYWYGLSDAVWTAIGLAVGTYLNWLFVARRLRQYSHEAGDAITIPDFLSNRYKENKKVIMTIAALFILIFFSVYAASCFVTVGKLFSTLFGSKYITMMIIGALFVVFYTYIGGFLAESASDFMQGIVMVIALTLVMITGVSHAGGISAIVENAKVVRSSLYRVISRMPTGTDTPSISLIIAASLSAKGTPLLRIPMIAKSSIPVFFSMISWEILVSALLIISASSTLALKTVSFISATVSPPKIKNRLK
jgi:sodium/proline symporter